MVKDKYEMGYFYIVGIINVKFVFDVFILILVN